MRFSHDRRGQSVVIGTVILFGFLILALSLYQVQVVPQQNGQVEFQHFEEVQNDLVDLRAGILQAGSTDQPQYQTVRLGTSYSTRVFAINPPAPAGTIRTSAPYNITITSDDTGETLNISTRFIEYRPGYNELDQPPTRYDASVLYLDGRGQGDGLVVIEDQELVDNDGDVRIVAVQNEFRRSGTRQVTLELRPSKNVTGNLPTGNLTITIPTRLNESEWETKTDLRTTINSTDGDIYGGVSADTNGDGVYNLTLNTTAEDLTVDTVGIQEAPEDPVQNENAQVGGNDDVAEENTPDTEIALRVDDLSHVSANRDQFITSFEVKNPGSTFERVEVEYDYQSANWADSTQIINDTRGRSEYFRDGAPAGDIDIRVSAIGKDGNGNEIELATRRVGTTANAVNPVEEALGSGSLSFQSVTFTDRSNNGQGPRYRIDYTADNTPEFDRVEGYIVSVSPSSGGRDSDQNFAASGRIDLSTYGYSSDFKLVALVVDNDGVVVDAQITTDEADGTDP